MTEPVGVHHDTQADIRECGTDNAYHAHLYIRIYEHHSVLETLVYICMLPFLVKHLFSVYVTISQFLKGHLYKY